MTELLDAPAPSLLRSRAAERPAARARAYAMVRIAAMPTREVARLRCDALERLLATITELESTHATTRDALSAALHTVIGSVSDGRTRRSLVTLRRTVYHGQAPADALLTSAMPALEASLRDDVLAAVERAHALRDAERVLHEAHRQALDHARQRFGRALASEDFRKGLLLSSRTLHDNLPKYQSAVASLRITSRAEQLERGLLRYFSRAVMKATPFARFCAVAPASFVDARGDERVLAFDSDPSVKRGFVRLNKTLYGILWRHLRARPVVRSRLVVDLNSTLEDEGDRLRFLARSRGKGETFQRIVRTDALDLVIAQVRLGHGATFGELVTAISSNPALDASEDDAREYLDAIIAHGLLRLRAAVAEQEADWEAPLCAAMSSVPDDHAARVVNALESVRDLVARYVEASAGERVDLDAGVRAALLALFADLGLGNALPRDLPLFEDASTTAHLHVHPSPAVAAAVRGVETWISTTRPLMWRRAEQATLRHFFDQQYVGTRDVPLLRFYEDFYREHFKEHMQRELRGRGQGDADYDTGNPFKLPLIEEMRAATRALNDLVRRRWTSDPDAAVLHLAPEEVRQALADITGGESTPAWSASTFCQLVPDRASGAASIVMTNGQYSAGYGKYFSRFLYTLPEDLQRRTREDNASLAGDALLAEICSDGDFNANLHPPLLPTEISYPTADSPASAAQLSCARIDVCADPADPNALLLRDRESGRRVLPVDLGFQNLRLRPPLFQLLHRFTPTGSFSIRFPEVPVARTATPTDSSPSDVAVTNPPVERVVHRPRIVFDGSLVLTRRRWTVPGSLVPRQASAEADGEFFLRVDRWRRTHGLPVEAYVHVVPTPARPPAASAHPSNADVAPEKRTADVETGVASTPAHPALRAAGEATIGDATNEARGAGARDAQRQAPRGGGPQRQARDHHKPQYIDFRSPLFVRLFARLAATVPHFRLVVEERYPGEAALPSYGADAYVSELVLNVDGGEPAHA